MEELDSVFTRRKYSFRSPSKVDWSACVFSHEAMAHWFFSHETACIVRERPALLFPYYYAANRERILRYPLIDEVLVRVLHVLPYKGAVYCATLEQILFGFASIFEGLLNPKYRPPQLKNRTFPMEISVMIKLPRNLTKVLENPRQEDIDYEKLSSSNKRKLRVVITLSLPSFGVEVKKDVRLQAVVSAYSSRGFIDMCRSMWSDAAELIYEGHLKCPRTGMPKGQEDVRKLRRLKIKRRKTR